MGGHPTNNVIHSVKCAIGDAGPRGPTIICGLIDGSAPPLRIVGLWASKKESGAAAEKD